MELLGPNWISIPEAAKLIRLTRGHLRRWVLKGKLAGRRIGKKLFVDLGELKRLVEVIDERGKC